LDRKIIQQLGRSLDWRKRYEILFRQVFSAGVSVADGLAFDAFISYSHAADGQLAAALQKGLHRFAKPLFKLRAVRVFRDETTLAMTPKLWPEIEKALRASRFFILMADPRSTQSEWVQKEVACWLDVKGANQILIVWTGGELVWDKLKMDFDWDRTTAVPPTTDCTISLRRRRHFTERFAWLATSRARTEVQLSLAQREWRRTKRKS
jgi:hypothetical protein